MGTVYRATQRSLRRIVALKVLHSQVSASPISVRRFEREAQAAAKLQHTHIVPIFAQGNEGGVHFYAMEYVDGPNLHELISSDRASVGGGTTTIDLDETVALDGSGAKPAPDAVNPTATDGRTEAEDSSVVSDSAYERRQRIASMFDEKHYTTVAEHVASIADALDYAHGQGVIHRDIKPHNLILGTDDRLRISDFGLARVAEQPGVTVTGEMLGSPLYMSPEQITQGPAGVDNRTDIYSLGATMYEWLALEPPYPGESRAQVIGKILHSEPPTPRSHNPAVPVDLETICLKAIERDRTRRYRTAGELRDDLKRFLAKRPIRARRANIPTRAGKFIARHPVSSIAAAGIVLAAGLGWSLYAERGKRKSTNVVAEQATAKAIVAEEERDQLLDFIDSILPAEIGGPISAAGAAIQGIMESGQALSGPRLQADGDAVNPASTSTPVGITRRAVLEFFNGADAQQRLSDLIAGSPQGQLLIPALDHWQEKKYENGLTFVNAFVQADPTALAALEFRAALNGMSGEFMAMLADVGALRQISGAEELAAIWSGLAQMLAGNSYQALVEMEVAIEQPDASNWCKIVLALAMVQERRPSEAVAVLNNVIALNADTAESIVAFLARARAQVELQQYELAVVDMSRVIELEPSNAHAFATRGLYQGMQANYAEAATDFRTAMNIGGKSTEVGLLWLAALQNRDVDGKKDSQPTTGDTPTPIGEGEDEQQDATRRRAEEMFSRFIWPVTPDETAPADDTPATPNIPGPAATSEDGTSGAKESGDSPVEDGTSPVEGGGPPATKKPGASGAKEDGVTPVDGGGVSPTKKDGSAPPNSDPP